MPKYFKEKQEFLVTLEDQTTLEIIKMTENVPSTMGDAEILMKFCDRFKWEGVNLKRPVPIKWRAKIALAVAKTFIKLRLDGLLLKLALFFSKKGRK